MAQELNVDTRFLTSEQADGVKKATQTVRDFQSGSDAVNSSVRTLGTPTSPAISALSNLVSTDPSAGEKSILEKFAERQKSVKEGSQARADLLKSQAGTSIEEQTQENDRELTSNMEARRGYATNTAFVKNIQETGKKRIRDLEKSRDELLLQNKIAEADKLDSLIGEEQTAITEARKTWIDNVLKLSGESRAQSAEDRAVASFETPAETQARELQNTKTIAVLNLQQVAPDAGILDTDDYNTAITKYRNSATYKRDVRKGEAEIANLQASTNKTISDLNGSDPSTSGLTPEQQIIQLDFLDETADKALSVAGSSGRSAGRRAVENVLWGATQFTELSAYTDTLKTNILALAADPNIKKFFGPQMSDADVRLMTSAGSILDPKLVGPDQMKLELERVKDMFARIKKSLPAGVTAGGVTGTGPEKPLVLAPEGSNDKTGMLSDTRTLIGPDPVADVSNMFFSMFNPKQ